MEIFNILKDMIGKGSRKPGKKTGKKEKSIPQTVHEVSDKKTFPAEDFQTPLIVHAEDDKQAVKHLKKTIAEVAVHLWRIKKRMTDENGEPLEEFRRHFRHVQAAMDDLINSEIEIKDFDHQIIPENGVLSIRVLAYQPIFGISSEKVIETVKPAIYYKGETIQYGEVIVGTPEKEGEIV